MKTYMFRNPVGSFQGFLRNLQNSIGLVTEKREACVVEHGVALCFKHVGRQLLEIRIFRACSINSVYNIEE